MRKWGEKSKAAYDTLDPRLQHYLDRVLQEVADISLVCGHRGQVEQNEAFYAMPQRSKLQWPDGNHNEYPSKAVDFQPYPMPDSEHKLWASLAYVAGRMIEMARQDGIVLRWGGDWNSNGDLTDQNFDDLFHIEIVESTDAIPSGTSLSAYNFRMRD
jgi:peptidoglycan L-alanyl-D-glutamate endopeptidase CwlK